MMTRALLDRPSRRRPADDVPRCRWPPRAMPCGNPVESSSRPGTERHAAPRGLPAVLVTAGSVLPAAASPDGTRDRDEAAGEGTQRGPCDGPVPRRGEVRPVRRVRPQHPRPASTTGAAGAWAARRRPVARPAEPRHALRHGDHRMPRRGRVLPRPRLRHRVADPVLRRPRHPLFTKDGRRVVLTAGDGDRHRHRATPTSILAAGWMA